MAVVATDGPVKGKWNALGVTIEVYRPQQILALAENLDSCSQDPPPISGASSGCLRIRERYGQPALRIGVQIRKRFADRDRCELSLGVNGHKGDSVESLTPY